MSCHFFFIPDIQKYPSSIAALVEIFRKFAKIHNHTKGLHFFLEAKNVDLETCIYYNFYIMETTIENV